MNHLMFSTVVLSGGRLFPAAKCAAPVRNSRLRESEQSPDLPDWS